MNWKDKAKEMIEEDILENGSKYKKNVNIDNFKEAYYQEIFAKKWSEETIYDIHYVIWMAILNEDCEKELLNFALKTFKKNFTGKENIIRKTKKIAFCIFLCWLIANLWLIVIDKIFFP